MTTSPPSTPRSEEQALLDAALGLLRERGTQGLKVGDVLARAGLGTRAFYRHFESKDRLVIEVFARAARAEAGRLLERMAGCADPLEAVTAWIEGRLDLAFDDDVQSDLQYVSQEAQALNAAAPAMMAEVHGAMLAPLVEQIGAGARDGTFAGVDPLADALAIDSVTWSCIERQWAAKDGTRDQVRRQVLTFCLRALGAAPARVEAAVDGPAADPDR